MILCLSRHTGCWPVSTAYIDSLAFWLLVGMGSAGMRTGQAMSKVGMCFTLPPCLIVIPTVTRSYNGHSCSPEAVLSHLPVLSKLLKNHFFLLPFMSRLEMIFHHYWFLGAQHPNCLLNTSLTSVNSPFHKLYRIKPFILCLELVSISFL